MGVAEDAQAPLPITGFYCMHSAASTLMRIKPLHQYCWHLWSNRFA